MNQLPTFLSAPQLIIKIRWGMDEDNSYHLAYATNLSFSQNMNTAGIQVIGAYANQNIEPLSYTASGSMSILSWGSASDTDTTSIDLPDGKGKKITNNVAYGNSNLHAMQMNPRKTIAAKTFDIEVYNKNGLPNLETLGGVPKFSKDELAAAVKAVAANQLGQRVYTIYDCRLTDWSLSFAPGQIASERVSFIARGVRLERFDNKGQNQDEDSKGVDAIFTDAAKTI